MFWNISWNTKYFKVFQKYFKIFWKTFEILLNTFKHFAILWKTFEIFRNILKYPMKYFGNTKYFEIFWNISWNTWNISKYLRVKHVLKYFEILWNILKHILQHFWNILKYFCEILEIFHETPETLLKYFKTCFARQNISVWTRL